MQPVREFSARSLREIYRMIGEGVASAPLVSGATLISAWKHALINSSMVLVGGFIRKSKTGKEYFCTNLEMKSPRGLEERELATCVKPTRDYEVRHHFVRWQQEGCSTLVSLVLVWAT